VWNLVSFIKSRTQKEGVSEQGAAEIFEPKREEIIEENYILKSFTICSLHRILLVPYNVGG
jgi:hypothetical protein